MDTNFLTVVEPRVTYMIEIEWKQPDGGDGLKIHEQISKLKLDGAIYTTDRAGFPTWGFYFKVWGLDRKEVKRHAEKVLRHLKRRKCEAEVFI